MCPCSEVYNGEIMHAQSCWGKNKPLIISSVTDLRPNYFFFFLLRHKWCVQMITSCSKLYFVPYIPCILSTAGKCMSRANLVLILTIFNVIVFPVMLDWLSLDGLTNEYKWEEPVGVLEGEGSWYLLLCWLIYLPNTWTLWY